MSATLVDRRNKWDDLKITVDGFKGMGVKVGFQGASGGETEDDYTIAQIAAVHEVGYAPGNIPARPFMRNAYEKNRDEIIRMLGQDIDEATQKKKTPKQILSRVGLFAASKVQEQIRTASQWAAPNADSTKKRKGSSSPLIDTGRMIQSVSWALTKNGTAEPEKALGGKFGGKKPKEKPAKEAATETKKPTKAKIIKEKAKLKAKKAKEKIKAKAAKNKAAKVQKLRTKKAKTKERLKLRKIRSKVKARERLKLRKTRARENKKIRIKAKKLQAKAKVLILKNRIRSEKIAQAKSKKIKAKNK